MSTNTSDTAIVLPSLGDGVTEVTISRWLKHVGDSVKRGEPLLEVETDKITTEVCAEADGRLANIALREGEHAQVGAAIGSLSPMQATVDETPPILPTPPPHASHISPVVSRMAAEHGLDLNAIPGTGEGGRVTKQDVLAFLARVKKEGEDKEDGGDRGEAYDLQPLTPMRRRIAEHMSASVRTSPHVTTIWEMDFSSASAHRAAHKASYAREGVALTWLAYVVHAAAGALKAHPAVNSQWRDDGIAHVRQINIGIAVALDDGLIVPVIHHADELNLKGIARRIGELAVRARANQLMPADVQGGTFSITNHGATGSLAATPIIHQPQCAILGLGAIEKRVKVATINGGDAITIRPCAYIGLTFDHRILDGAAADAFVASLKQKIENTWDDM